MAGDEDHTDLQRRLERLLRPAPDAAPPALDLESRLAQLRGAQPAVAAPAKRGAPILPVAPPRGEDEEVDELLARAHEQVALEGARRAQDGSARGAPMKASAAVLARDEVAGELDEDEVAHAKPEEQRRRDERRLHEEATRALGEYKRALTAATAGSAPSDKQKAKPLQDVPFGDEDADEDALADDLVRQLAEEQALEEQHDS